MKANVFKIDNQTDVLKKTEFGIGYDCDYSNVNEILDEYESAFGKPDQLSDMLFLFRSLDYNYYVEIDPQPVYKIGQIVRSHDRFSPYTFDGAEIIEVYYSSFYPNYTIRLKDGNIRYCRECDIRLEKFF